MIEVTPPQRQRDDDGGPTAQKSGAQCQRQVVYGDNECQARSA